MEKSWFLLQRRMAETYSGYDAKEWPPDRWQTIFESDKLEVLQRQMAGEERKQLYQMWIFRIYEIGEEEVAEPVAATHACAGSGARQFRKKPVVIDAEQYVEYGKLVKGMCNSRSCYTAGNNKPHVHTIHENQMVILKVGDWIIPEPDGEHFYPVKPDIFEATYEPVAGEPHEKPTGSGGK